MSLHFNLIDHSFIARS